MRNADGDLSWPTRSRMRTSRTYSSSSATKDSIRGERLGFGGMFENPRGRLPIGRRLPACPTCFQQAVGFYLELRTNWLPSRSLKMAEVPQDSTFGGAMNSTPRDFNCS